MPDEAQDSKELSPKTIEDVLRAREELDDLLNKNFRKRVAILFSDVCGYTQYMDSRGDISGRAWIQKHNNIVYPVLEAFEGKLLKEMGDGILVLFEHPLEAIKACVEIQRKLLEYNAGTDAADQIHVSMGINTGEILMDDLHIAGDVVNVASRIETVADKDQILISKTTYEDVRGSEDILCRFNGLTQVKGKSRPLELYRVVWKDDEVILSDEPQIRAGGEPARTRSRTPRQCLKLEVSRDNDRLSISAYEQSAGETTTVTHYEELPVSMGKIQERSLEIVDTLNNANRKGRLDRSVLKKLRDIGQVFRDELLTPHVKEQVRSSESDHLILNIDDQLVQVPWELLHDGKQFLCQRFSMGRIVKTRQSVLADKSRLLARPLKMLVLADPNGDLKGAYKEGTEIRDFLDQDHSRIDVSLLSSGVTPAFLQEKVRNFDMVHYAGHAEYNTSDPRESGWRLSDGILKADEIVRMAGTGSMPALIFSNACQSARTEAWAIKQQFQHEIYGLANAFILSGVKHFLGTFWEILDEPSRKYALAFYNHLFSGKTIGEATREARLDLVREFGEETIVWASYLLYGDPTFNYLDQLEDREKPQEPSPEEAAAEPGIEVRSQKDRVTFGAEPEKKPRKVRWAVGALGLMAALLLVAYFAWIRPAGTQKDLQAALASFQAGAYSQTTEICNRLLDKKPDHPLPQVLLGSIAIRNGDLAEAERRFEKARDASGGTGEYRADALMGLGRVASLRGDKNRALEYYRQAASLNGSQRARVSQALLLEGQGQYAQALSLFEQAMGSGDADPALGALAEETRKRVSIQEDREKQERIETLIDELLSQPQQSAPVTEDPWTSGVLSIWLMDFETQGYSLQEGGERILSAGIMDRVVRNSRARVVERAVLDKLLEELRLGTSKLVDRATALSLGRLMSARLILSGLIIHAGQETQITVRLIETETGQVKAAITEAFEAGARPSAMAETLGTALIHELETLYPLRGIVAQEEGRITLNIGEDQGVRVGQTFQARNGDLLWEVEEVQPAASVLKPAAEGGKGDLPAPVKAQIVARKEA